MKPRTIAEEQEFSALMACLSGDKWNAILDLFASVRNAAPLCKHNDASTPAQREYAPTLMNGR